MAEERYKPIGYQWLAKRFATRAMPHWPSSGLGMSRRTEVIKGGCLEIYPAAYDPGDDPIAHLEFALKREGLHLELLRQILLNLDDALVHYLKARPTGRFARQAWYLYEGFTGKKLPIPDAKTGSYVNLLDPKIYYAGPVMKSQRHRVNVNLLGNLEFSPLVRRSEKLKEGEARRLEARCREIVAQYPREIFTRAMRYFYTKESKSSFAIERETPDQKRAGRFVALLQQAERRNFLEKSALVEAQQIIVEERFANAAYRSATNEQIYVGRSIAPNREEVHFAGPKPEDLDALMHNFLEMAAGLISREEIPAIVAAGVVAFVFDFLHPFSDGNGRLHRFLIHHVLALRKFGPEGLILPISAVMLNRPQDYDDALEAFSIPLMKLVEYELDGQLRMIVLNETANHYRYIDCTPMVEALYEFVKETIEKELPAEVEFLQRYDAARRGMSEFVVLPDRAADLFVRLCLQNQGRLSNVKRKLDLFAKLDNDEIDALEVVVQRAFALAPSAD